jgi:hypothetical protein
MSVTIKFNADASGVHSALAGVTGQIDGLKEEMSGLSWADFALGAEAVIGLLSRAAGAARGLFEAVIAPAAEMEQYMVRFETVLGSAAQAAAYMQQLTDYANSTPFEMSELADAASTLLSFGTSAEKSVAVLKQLGDMAAVTGASVAELASIYGKVGSVGFETESANQLASRGLNVRAIWAKRDGISEAEVQKNIAAKKYGQADLDYALRVETSAGGKFAGGADKQANTLNGRMSTLADTWNAEMVKIGQTLMESLNGALAGVTEALPALFESIRPAVDDLAEVIAQMLASLPDIMEEVKPLFQGLAEFVSTVLDYLPQIISYLRTFLAIMVSVKVASMLTAGYIAAKAAWAAAITSVRNFRAGLVGCQVTARGLLGIFRSIGRVGWMLIITTAVEALMALYDKFFGSDADEEAAREAEEERRREEAERKKREKEERESRRQAGRESIKRAWSDRDKIMDLSQVYSLEEYEQRLKQLDALAEDMMEAMRNSGGDEWLEQQYRNTAEGLRGNRQFMESRRAEMVERDRKRRLNESRTALQERETKRVKDEQAEMDKQWRKSFEAADSATQLSRLAEKMKQAGLRTDFADIGEAMGLLDNARNAAVTGGDVAQYELIRALEDLGNVIWKTREKEAEAAKELERTAAAKREELQREAQRDALVLRGDEAALAAFDDEHARRRLAAEYEAAGIDAREAELLAAGKVARERAKQEQAEAPSPAVIAASTVAIGGGGHTFRLGDAQLDVAQRQLAVGEEVRDILSGLARAFGKNATLAVVA